MKINLSRLYRSIGIGVLNTLRSNTLFEKFFVLQGVCVALQLRNTSKINKLEDIEFSVFSQWGEDGIIEWLIQKNGDMPEIFVEFGVENFRESNCRFLLMNRNWRGLVIDGSEKNIQTIKGDDISWRHDLTSICQFITSNNINSIIESSGISGEIGFLSVDIDGNDYWVWESIKCIQPHFVIAEYNSAFGDLLPITIPYREDFVRSKANFSNLYYGSSIVALCELATQRGYSLLGSNRAGSNAFFVRNDRMHIFDSLIQNKSVRPSRFREGRDYFGKLNFVRGIDRTGSIKDMPIVNVKTCQQNALGEAGNLFSDEWLADIDGRTL